MADEPRKFTVAEVDPQDVAAEQYGHNPPFAATDDHDIAVRRCEGWEKPAIVRRTSDNKVIYRNFCV